MNPHDSQIHCCRVCVVTRVRLAPERPAATLQQVEIDRPPPGEELHEGPEMPAREAASVILLRDAPAGPEVLLVQRNPEARFMGGAWVFPGGSVHPDDAGPAGAGRRELAEEAGVTLPDTGSLILFSRWITPAQVKIRFDTV